MSEAVLPMITPELVMGIADAELINPAKLDCLLHPLVVEPLQQLNDAAKSAGYCLQVASSYRNFERQLLIWNSKVNGERPVLDKHGQPLDIASLSDEEKIYAILYWSALPGASRHHWGTDLDVYDSSAMPENYSVQLTVEETQGNGPFAEFHRWLNVELIENSRGFFRPFIKNVGGVAPEPWHLSYAPVANLYAMQMNEALLREQLQKTDIELKATLLENLSEIYSCFIKPYC